MALPGKKPPMSMDQAFGAAKAAMPPMGPPPGGDMDTGPEMVTCPKCGTTFDASMAKAGAGAPPPAPMGGGPLA